MATSDTSRQSSRRAVKSARTAASAARKPSAAPADVELKLSPAQGKPIPGSDEPGRGKPKQKLVRDSFTMPAHDFSLIALLKDRMVAYRRPAKKSELLRAGLHALMALPDAKLAAALDELAPLKPGRPRKRA